MDMTGSLRGPADGRGANGSNGDYIGVDIGVKGGMRGNDFGNLDTGE